MGEHETCPNCHEGTLEPEQQGRVADDSIEIRVMVPTCPKCGWSVTKMRCLASRRETQR
ncbi:hypothetical protein MHAE_17635 [Mycobacterium haemophilum DSM 44634]